MIKMVDILFLEVYNEKLVVEKDNKGWHAKHLFYELRDRDILKR